ncbi:helix-turn-helix domain-containing protein [Terriglobus sp. YAF25]|uniref:helix-turn-helix domain-containing protein n=1 Tax=Terriglobus sp. YAF25 TaxID=3233080 RepID=UPI003F963607
MSSTSTCLLCATTSVMFQRSHSLVELEVGTTVDEAERQLILKTLESTNNNKTRAAEILGISSKTLQNKLKEYASAGDEA